jgi:hypothetical protein
VPSEDRSTVDNQIAGTNQPTTNGGQDAEDEESFRQWGSCLFPALALRCWAGNAGMSIFAKARKPHARAKAGYERSQSRISW